MPENEINSPTPALCPTCHGTRRFPGYESMYCPTCKATGYANPADVAKYGQRPDVYPEGYFENVHGVVTMPVQQPSMTHECREMAVQISEHIAPSESNLGGIQDISRYGDVWWAIVNDGEYVVHVTYCPFCGVKL